MTDGSQRSETLRTRTQRGQELPAARDPFLRKVATVVAILVVAGLLLAAVILGIKILLAAFAGILFAILLRAFTDLVTRYTPLSDGWALTLVLLVIMGVLGVGGVLLAPQVAEQGDELAQQLPEMFAEIQGFLQQYAWGQWLLEQIQPDQMAEGTVGGVGDFLSALSRWSSYFLVAFFVGLFAAANPGLYTDGAVHLFPLRHRARIRELIGELGYTLRWWLIGQGLAMIVIGVSTMIVLWIFGVPLALVIGLIVGLLGFVPYLGPIVGMVPVALVGATQGAATLLYLLLAYTGVQLLEGYVATPLIQERTVYLPPAVTITFQVLLGAVVGLLGFVLATPLAAVLLVLSKYYRTDILGDPHASEDEEEEKGDQDENDKEE